MKKTQKQIVAIIGVILLLSMSILALIFAILDFPGSARISIGFLIGSVFMPLLIWIYIWLYGQLTSKKTIATIWEKTETSNIDELEEDN